MGRIKAGSPVQRSANIQLGGVPADDKIAFSFKYLDLTGNDKFTVGRCGDGYFPKFIDRLVALSKYTIRELLQATSHALRFHSHDWSRTTEPNGFRLPNTQIQDLQGWQFQVSANEHGRVHGFIIDRTFYLVWIDPEHLLYAGKRK